MLQRMQSGVREQLLLRKLFVFVQWLKLATIDPPFGQPRTLD